MTTLTANINYFHTSLLLQVTARQSGLPLDKMTIETHVTTMTSPEQVQEPPADGAFVHGLFLEGARWTVSDEVRACVRVCVRAHVRYV